MDFVKFLEGNWAVISQAPWAFAICAILSGAIGYAIAVRLTAERLALAEARVADYKDKLEGKTPDEVADRIAALENQLRAATYWTLTPEQLKAIRAALQNGRFGIEIIRDASSPRLDAAHRQLISIFKEAGWVVHDWVTLDQPERPNGDVTLYVPRIANDDAISMLGKAIADAELSVERRPLDTPAAVMPRLFLSEARA